MVAVAAPRVGAAAGRTLALGAVLASYGGDPGVHTRYPTRVVPYALEVYNIAYHNRWASCWRAPKRCWCRSRRCSTWHPAPLAAPRQRGDVFGAAGLAMLVIYLVQMKGWNCPTTRQPRCWSCWRAISPWQRPRWGRRCGGSAPRSCLLLTKAALLTGNRYPLMDRLLPVIGAHAAAVICFFASNTWTGFPIALYADVGWASRFPALWLLPGRQRGAGRDRALAEIFRFMTAAVITLSARRPDLVFVAAGSEKPWYASTACDFIEHFAVSGVCRFWAGYERIDAIEGFEIYRRRPAVHFSSTEAG